MKKSVLLSVALLMLFSLAVIGLQPALAANADDMVVVYVTVPDDWEDPCFWAWDDAGNNAFDAWPGGEAEADPNNPGWYYCYLPNWAVNIIVNANEGTVQTDGLASEGGNIWITVNSPEEAEISYDALTKGEAPEYVEKISVYARVPAGWDAPGLWAWLDPEGTNAFESWPGAPMKESGEWYTVKAPSWINSVIINANEGSVQTSDYKGLEKGNIWIVVADDGSAEIFYENPDLIVPDITVRAYVPTDWETPCLWAWLDPEGTNAYASWPGEPFTLNGDWYEIAVPGWVNSLIVNANGGSVQTGDMKGLDIGKDVWIVVTDADNYEYSYEQPDIPEVSEPEPEPEEKPTPPPVETAPISEPESTGGTRVLLIVLGVLGVVIIVTIIVVVIVKKKK